MDAFTKIWVSFLIFAAATLASAAGTGGGALYIPGYVVALQDVHRAVPLSKVTIFGACMVSVLLNLRRKQPSGVLPLISYELAAILEPFTLMGGIIGVLLNIVMTDVQIIVCLVAVLSFTTYKTTRKGLLQYRQETAILEARRMGREEEKETTGDAEWGRKTGGSEGEESSGTTPLLGREREPSALESTASAGEVSGLTAFGSFAAAAAVLPATLLETPETLLDSTPPPQSPREAEDKEIAAGRLASVAARSVVEEGREGEELVKLAGGGSFESVLQERRSILEARDRPSWPSILYLLFAVSVNVVLLLLAGGPVALLCGESWQQLCILLLLSFHVAATLLFGRWLLRGKQRRERLGIRDVDVEHGGLGWVSPRNIIFYPFLSLLAGVAAGSIGIGGGLIKGPLLLEIGLNSLSAVTTANFMILFTSSANTLQYATLGRLNLYESLHFFFIAFAAGAIGLFCVTRALVKSKRQSYLTLLLAFTTIMSMLAMLFSFVYNRVNDLHAQKPLTLEDACTQRHRLLFIHS